MKGYMGNILEVNLTTGAVGKTTVEREVLRKFIGGGGVAAKLFLDRVSPDVDPLSGGNVLFLMTGPLTGVRLPGAARFAACFKSPLTGIWGETNCGGNFGVGMRFAGYDGIAIEGASDKPVSIVIEDEHVEIRDASDIWGMDTYEVTDILKKQFKGGKEVKVLTIGQAGEKLVRYAAIINDKRSALGRTGGGAVMGSKKLKAVVIRGTGSVEPADAAGFEKIRKEVLEKVKTSKDTESLRAYGTAGGMVAGTKRGDVPYKNWALGQDLDIARKISGQVMAKEYLVKTAACHGCPVACKRVVSVKEGPYATEEGPGPEYETLASFGSMLMVDDLAGLIKINEACNRYGVDTISCGCTIAFAIDCFENGIIDSGDTGGIELKWGNADAVLKMVERIGRREGLGDILAEGSRRAAQRLGGKAVDYAIESKGLEAPMHDPRAGHGLGLAYATSIRGACHNQHLVLAIEADGMSYPEIGLPGPYEAKTSEGKAKMTMLCEDLGMVVNSAIICQFVLGSLSLRDLVDMLRTTTGFDYSLAEMMECGERIWLLKRGLCNLMGVRAVDDRLPKRMLTPVKEGGAAGSVPDMALMLRDYYRLRPLDDEGRPAKDKLRSLGLSDLADRL
ncbi:MAG TPA: aldehyde ferredoxin oxidoreductase family protein [Dehalococcoidia bacterium]|nr:aldehyde ferredoxin oxidoreductase family protein [Dehalococcoidia bacterium]